MPAYVVPEVIFAEEPDQRTDIYALGCVAYFPPNHKSQICNLQSAILRPPRTHHAQGDGGQYSDHQDHHPTRFDLLQPFGLQLEHVVARKIEPPVELR